LAAYHVLGLEKIQENLEPEVDLLVKDVLVLSVAQDDAAQGQRNLQAYDETCGWKFTNGQNA